MAGRTLWSRDQDVYRLLRWLTGSRKGWQLPPGQIYRWRGVTVTAAAPKLPYGWASGRFDPARTVTHNTSLVLMAWRRGVLVGAMARWLCGAITTEPVFEPGTTLRLCPVCWMRVTGPPVVITNSVVFMEAR